MLMKNTLVNIQIVIHPYPMTSVNHICVSDYRACVVSSCRYCHVELYDMQTPALLRIVGGLVRSGLVKLNMHKNEGTCLL